MRKILLALTTLALAAPALAQQAALMQPGQRMQTGVAIGERSVREVMISQDGSGVAIVYGMGSLYTSICPSLVLQARPAVPLHALQTPQGRYPAPLSSCRHALQHPPVPPTSSGHPQVTCPGLSWVLGMIGICQEGG